MDAQQSRLVFCDWINSHHLSILLQRGFFEPNHAQPRTDSWGDGG